MEDMTSGHKRHLDWLWDYVDSNNGNSQELLHEIELIIVKSLACVQPSLSHVFKTILPNDTDNNMCFEVLGFDILLDSQFKPWLLEVNLAPSFNSDSPLDTHIKSQVL